MVYEGEGVGMILGLELIREERQVGGMAKMGVDNVAAIITTHAIKPEPSHHKWDWFHQSVNMVYNKYKIWTY